MLPSATTSATRCGGEPTTAAELSYSYDGSVWLVFFCRDHGEALNIRWDIES